MLITNLCFTVVLNVFNKEYCVKRDMNKFVFELTFFVHERLSQNNNNLCAFNSLKKDKFSEPKKYQTPD